MTAPSRNDPSAAFDGFDIFLIGPFGAFMGQFAWFANLTFWVLAAMMMAGRGSKEARFVTLLVHVCLTASSLFWTSWPADEGGVNYFHITNYHWAYYSWLSCMIGIVLLVLQDLFLRKQASE